MLARNRGRLELFSAALRIARFARHRRVIFVQLRSGASSHFLIDDVFTTKTDDRWPDLLLLHTGLVTARRRFSEDTTVLSLVVRGQTELVVLRNALYNVLLHFERRWRVARCEVSVNQRTVAIDRVSLTIQDEGRRIVFEGRANRSDDELTVRVDRKAVRNAISAVEVASHGRRTGQLRHISCVAVCREPRRWNGHELNSRSSTRRLLSEQQVEVTSMVENDVTVRIVPAVRSGFAFYEYLRDVTQAPILRIYRAQSKVQVVTSIAVVFLMEPTEVIATVSGVNSTRDQVHVLLLVAQLPELVIVATVLRDRDTFRVVAVGVVLEQIKVAAYAVNPNVVLIVPFRPAAERIERVAIPRHTKTIDLLFTCPIRAIAKVHPAQRVSGPKIR